MFDIPRFTYSRWRHGGWYVDNIRYPSGACGCVSRNYPDGRWRIVCDSRPFDERPTFRTRDGAALAEWKLVRELSGQPEQQPAPAHGLDPRIDAASLAHGGRRTLFDYLYRDADNYQQSASITFPDSLTLDQAIAILAATDAEDGFVPSAVGLDDLQSRTVNGWQPDADHPFHEVAGISWVDTPATTEQIATDFLARFLAADWDEEANRVIAEHARRSDQ